MAGISFLPNACYALLWLAPLLVVGGGLGLAGQRTPFSSWFAEGDRRELVCLSLGALLCGFFWEMWNYASLPKWHYSVPYVQACLIFEMPLLGYAGYLPFGVECCLCFVLVKRAFPCRALTRLEAYACSDAGAGSVSRRK